MVNLYYKGSYGNAAKFVKEMESSGIADAKKIRRGADISDNGLAIKGSEVNESMITIENWV